MRKSPDVMDDEQRRIAFCVRMRKVAGVAVGATVCGLHYAGARMGGHGDLRAAIPLIIVSVLILGHILPRNSTARSNNPVQYIRSRRRTYFAVSAWAILIIAAYLTVPFVYKEASIATNSVTQYARGIIHRLMFGDNH